jgi:hypothetical protein
MRNKEVYQCKHLTVQYRLRDRNLIGRLHQGRSIPLYRRFLYRRFLLVHQPRLKHQIRGASRLRGRRRQRHRCQLLIGRRRRRLCLILYPTRYRLRIQRAAQ